MTTEQEKHLARIKANFTLEVDAKYRKGQEEHGGNLLDLRYLDLIDRALEEAIDQVVYLDTLREKFINQMNLSPYYVDSSNKIGEGK